MRDTRTHAVSARTGRLYFRSSAFTHTNLPSQPKQTQPPFRSNPRKHPMDVTQQENPAVCPGMLCSLKRGFILGFIVLWNAPHKNPCCICICIPNSFSSFIFASMSGFTPAPHLTTQYIVRIYARISEIQTFNYYQTRVLQPMRTIF